MGTSLRSGRSKDLAARAKRLPAELQGPVVLVLLGNTVFTIVLQASWLVLVWQAVRRAIRNRDYGPGQMLQAARSPASAVVTVVMVVHRLSHPLFVRALDHWLTDKDRLAGSPPGQPGSG